MRFIGLLMRLYSYLFHIVLAVAMMGLAAVAWLSNHPLEIWVLPWQGTSLTYWLFFGGLAGALITVLAAVFKKLPALFALWAVIVFIVLARGFFFSSYTFGPMATSLTTALWFVAGALLAAIGSLFQFGRSQGAMKRRTALA